MRRNTLAVALSLALLPVAAWGQQQATPSAPAVAPVQAAPAAAAAPAAPLTTERDVYCSGMMTTAPVSRSTEIVSGEQSLYKVSFDEGDYVYINRGSDKGVKVGDVFSVMRPVEDWTGIPWFTSQPGLMHSMGQMWEDEGRLKVIDVHPKVSVAQIMSGSCSFIQRGDVVEPFAEREVPELKSEANFDRLAPPSGKKKGMVVVTKGFGIESGTNDIVYVNLGSKQGVKAGDYLRIYRYQSNEDNSVFQTPAMGTSVEGYGSGPSISPKDLPREVLGEGIVLRATPNASTVLITLSLREIYDGDHCEIE